MTCERLCFCRACTARFQVDVGRFTLMGPLLRQTFTCVSGRTCAVNDFGVWHPRAQDRLMILDTCGTEDAWPQITMPARSVATFVNHPGLTAFSTGPNVVFLSGGAYRLCWSGVALQDANLSTFSDSSQNFNIDAGVLHLIGPAPLTQDRTCISGETCSIRDIRGLFASDSWMVMVLDTCRSQSNFTQNSIIPGFPNSGLAHTVVDVRLQNLSQNNLSTFNASDASDFHNLLPEGLTFSWGSSPVTASGGIYRLCWCAGPPGLPLPGNRTGNQTERSEGSESCDFLDMGRLMLVGPVFSQTGTASTCISGQTCSLRGLRRVPTDTPGQLLVMDTCGSFGALLPRFGFTTSATSERNSPIQWDVPITALGGQYRLCWCALQNRSLGSANWTFAPAEVRCDMDDFLADIGALHLLGPERRITRTCISGWTCQFQLSAGVASLDSLMLLETCGVDEAVVHRVPGAGAATVFGSGSIVSWGDALLTAPGGLYRLCWCRMLGGNVTVNQSRQGQCALPQDHRVDAGSVLLVGPSPLQQDRTCIAGRTCSTERIYGESLGPTDSLQLLATCGVPEGTIPRFPLNGLIVSDVNSSQLPSGMAVQAGFESNIVSAPGGLYRLCWCSGLTPSTCVHATDFQTDLGVMTILGVSPQQQDRTCISGRVCSVDPLLGLGLSISDSYMILGTCGQPTTLTTPGVGQSFGSLPKITWTEVLTAAGGEYRLCWCSGLPSAHTVQGNTSNTSVVVESFRNNTDGPCSVSWDFGIDAGRLLLLGPAPLSQRSTCAAGQACVINIAGIGLASADLVMVQETCGQPLALTPFTGPSSLQLASYNISTNSSVAAS
ncbi:agaA33 [Symbiodinium natans]|uniref:AgaA33 protein n=1 Tax=Symbiodinium natans TaxID=878477 RepID=A0A812PQL1_9DINO|nr:agaA33 [Symbiodinium natans]